ncbi:MAG TPA: glycosyltransferase [Thermoleophilaceae bacterium]
MTRVCGVIPTIGRRELLRQCLDAMRAQTRPVAELLVLDNGSDDGTRDELAAMTDVRHVRTPARSGSAGAFRAAIEAATALDVDWLWLMDDDGEPLPDALERLLSSPLAEDPAVAALSPAVIGPDGRIDVLHRGFMGRLMRPLPAEEYRPGTAPRLGFSSFNGMLVRAEAARAAGPPLAEMYTQGDDVEWSLRLRRHGELRLIPESRVLHKALVGGVSTRRSRFWNRVFGVSYQAAPFEDFWRTLHLVRNFVWIRYHHGDPGRGAYLWTAGAYAIRSLLYEDRALRRIPWIFRAATRGRRGQPLGLTGTDWRRTIDAGH